MIQLLTGAWRQLLLAGAIGLGFLAMYYYPDRTPFLRFEATTTYSWMMMSFALWVGLAVYLYRPALEFLKKGFPKERAQAIGLIALLTASGVYVVSHSEARYRMLSDEHNHLQVAMSMHYFQRAERCDEGNFFDTDLQCHKFVTDIRPKTFPMLAYVGYSLFGFKEAVHFWLNFVLYIVTALLIFRLAHELGLKYWGQLFAVMAWLYWPVNVWWARTAGYEMSYVFFVSLSCLGSWWIRHSQNPKERLGIAAWLGITIAFACQTRHEAYVMMPVVLAPAFWFFLKEWKPAAMGLLSWGLAVVPGIVVRAAFKDDFIGDANGQPGVGWANFATNFPDNIEFLFNPNGFWPTHTALSVLGTLGMLWMIVRMIRHPHERPGGASLLLWIWASILSISFFYWGKFQLFAHMRYSISVYPPLALLGGYAAGHLIESKKSWTWIKYGFFGFFIFVAFKTAPIVEGNRLLNAILLTTEDHYIPQIIEKLPEHSVFLYTRPAAFLVRKKSSYSYAQLMIPGDEWLNWAKQRTQGNVYYIRGLDCWRDKKVNFPEIDAWNSCDQIEDKFEVQETLSFPVAGNYSLRVMKVLGPKSQVKPSS